MSKNFSVPRGTHDILPEEILPWSQLESMSRNILQNYGYREIRTPIFEETDLFARSLGQTSDVVQKQMLNIKPATEEKDSQFSLRPEGTASVVRSYIENNIDKRETLSKFFYIGPMFRGERPQKGRLRQFHHVGVEAIGISEPFLDAEVISLAVYLIQSLGIEGFKLKINSLGSAEDKQALSQGLRTRLKAHIPSLCEDCQQRFERNVFRILDCKNEPCKKIVHQLDLAESHLSTASKAYFTKVKEALNSLNISFEVSQYLVRGLDYYTHTVFEISHPGLGSQDALGAGGRYDNLVKELGGPHLGAMGFALGIERLLLAQTPNTAQSQSSIKAFVVTMGESAYRRGFLLLNEMRRLGIASDMNYQTASMKSQMRLADKLQAHYVLILGDDELKEDAVTLKDMQKGEQQKIPLKDVGKVIKEKL